MKSWFLLLISFILTFAFELFLINKEKRHLIGQIERELGPSSHKAKNHTPTMGGLFFLIVPTVLFIINVCLKKGDYYLTFLLLFPFLTYGLLGLIDDLLIIKMKSNEGINPSLKFFLQIIIAVIYFIAYLKFQFNTTLDLFFVKIDLKFFYGIFILLAFAGFSNALNLTDGIDGLLTINFLISISFFIIHSKLSLVNNFMYLLISSLLAFLYFNLPKAKLFMGNVGALALGGVFVSIAIVLHLERYLFLIGFIYILEALSVVIQVTYFKISKGNRIFKMAPIHHHFEIVLGSETKALGVMTIINIFFTILAFWVAK